MGFLDQLKAQADEQQRKDEEITQWRMQVLSTNFLAVQAKMGEINRAFNTLAEALNKLKGTAARRYDIEGTPLDGMFQSDYTVRQKKFTQDGRDYFKEVQFRFKCIGEGDLSVARDGENAVNRLREFLTGCGLTFDCEEQRAERRYVEKATFTVRREVPVVIGADGNVEEGIIRIRWKNFERLGAVSEFVYKPDEIDQTLLDQLAMLIAGQPSRFKELGERQQAMQAAFREAQEKARRAKEEAMTGGQEQAKAAAGEKQPGLVGKLFSIFK